MTDKPKTTLTIGDKTYPATGELKDHGYGELVITYQDLGATTDQEAQDAISHDMYATFEGNYLGQHQTVPVHVEYTETDAQKGKHVLRVRRSVK